MTPRLPLERVVRVSALATVLMDYPLKPYEIAREGIRGLSMEQVRSAMMTLAPALAAWCTLAPRLRASASAGECRCGQALQAGVPGGKADR